MKLRPFPDRYKNLFILLFIIGGYSVFFWLQNRLTPEEIEFCMFKNITGIPCPGCGMGRGTNALFHGNLMHSFLLHPLAIPFNAAVFAAFLFLIKDVVKNENMVMGFLKRKPPVALSVTIALLLLAIWGWNIYRGI